jgi:5'-methylthioadenosine phosphorylase
LVTDMDAGAGAERGVHQEDVFALFAANTERLKRLLTGVIADLPDPDGCSCDTWADSIDLTYVIP